MLSEKSTFRRGLNIRIVEKQFMLSNPSDFYNWLSFYGVKVFNIVLEQVQRQEKLFKFRKNL